MATDPQYAGRRLRATAHEAAESIVRVLQGEGYTAYFAGGCVRDQIMGREPSDYDVATDAPPEHVLELFRPSHWVGQAFGVVMVRQKGHWVEVAAFRSESGYTDHRHPDHVEFTDAHHDALRRDFTVNGLFYDPLADRVIDYVEGQADIERRVIRAIGRPQERFDEDYLRMLRAVRFAARLDFRIEPATAEAIKTHAARLDGISRERIGQEMQFMLEAPTRAAAAHLIQELHLDAPALREPTSDREPITLGRLPAKTAYPTALAAWVLDRHMQPHEPTSLLGLIDALDRVKAVQVTRHWRRAMVLSNGQRDALGELLTALPQVVLWPQLNVAQRKRLLARADWPALRELLGAVARLPAESGLDLAQLDREARALCTEGVAPSPLVSGDDLIAAGFKPGPMFKRLLEKVYDAQLSGMVTTREEAQNLARSLAESSEG